MNTTNKGCDNCGGPFNHFVQDNARVCYGCLKPSQEPSAAVPLRDEVTGRVFSPGGASIPELRVPFVFPV